MRFPAVVLIMAILVFAFGARVYTLWDSTAMAAEEKDETRAPVLKPLPTARAGTTKEKPASTSNNKKTAQSAAEPEDPLKGRDLVEFSASELSLLQSLRQRREELAERERALVEKERLLAGMESQVEQKIKNLEDIRKKIEGTKKDIEGLVKTGQGQDDARIASLVRVYEKMKPKEAARIFDNLELSILLDVVRKMNEGRLAPILAGMDPQKATLVTATLGKRTEMPALASALPLESPDSSPSASKKPAPKKPSP